MSIEPGNTTKTFAGETYDDLLALVTLQSPPDHRHDGGPHNPKWVAMKKRESNWLPNVVTDFLYGGLPLESTYPPTSHVDASTINGNNGSATNTDDHAAKMQHIKKEIAKAIVSEEHKVAANRARNPKVTRSVSHKVMQETNSMQRRLDSVSAVPAAIAVLKGTRKPRIEHLGNGNTLFSHEEFFYTSAPASANFTVAPLFSVNPGMASLFPWLSSEAYNFEKYHIRRLTLKYVARVSSNSSGSVMLVPDYDPADPAPNCESDAMQYTGGKDNSNWKSFEIKFDCSLQPKGGLFLRSGPLLPNLDIKLYDAGNLYICTEGLAATLGKLWVDYSIELIKPQANPGHVGMNATVDLQGGGTSAAPFGAAPYVPGNGVTGYILNPGTNLSSVVNQTLQLANIIAGREYFLNASFVGTVLAIGAPTYGTGLVGVSSLNVGNAGATAINAAYSFIGGATNNPTITFTFTCTTVTNAYFTLGALPINAGF